MANRYDPFAEPVVGSVVDRRPCYVAQRVVDELVGAGGWLSVWRLGATVTTVETRGHAMVRPLEAWGAPADLARAITWWTRRKMRAPSSPAGMIRKACPLWYFPLAWSRHGWALPHLVGGWQEAKVRGVILGPHRLYDLRRAYRWALTADALPDRRAIQIAKRWTPDRPGLHLVDLDPWPGAPWPLRDGGPCLVETPADVALYGTPGVRAWLGGVTWTRTVRGDELAGVIDETEVAACARTYWGPWVAQTPVQRTYQTGTVTQLKPRGTDAVRGHLILHRVRRRLAELQADYRYVDAVMLPADRPVTVGERPGEWRVVRDYPNGVWIGYPGAYGPATGRPDRLAGVSR